MCLHHTSLVELLFCPAERNVPSKTSAFDDSVMLDSPGVTWAAQWIEALQRRPQNKSICFFDQVAYTITFHSIAAHANVAFLNVPTRHRHLSQIRARGRWRADCSLQRYKKETRALQRIAVPNPATVAHGQTTLCTADTDSQAARRRSLQTALRQCWQTTKQHRPRLAALHISLTVFSHTFFPLLAGWMAAKVKRISRSFL